MLQYMRFSKKAAVSIILSYLPVYVTYRTVVTDHLLNVPFNLI